MKYFAALTKKDAINLANFGFTVTEKIDGSSFEFGIDELGFYSTKKGWKKCRSVDDWTIENWAIGYRSAHRFAQAILINNHEKIKSENFRAICELLLVRRQNTIEYDINHPTIIVISQTENVLEPQKIKFPNQKLVVEDGEIVSIFENVEWEIRILERIEMKLPALAWVAISRIHGVEYDLINLEKLTKVTYLDKSKTNKKGVDKLIRRTEKFVRKNFRGFISGQSEGYVITLQNGNTYKILTDEANFKRANYFTYWIKFNIVGGRRPKKHSFLSRTENWTVEKRLERLEMLKSRYEKYRSKLIRTYGELKVEYSEDLHVRMLAMFADTKARISNGR